eukprot:4478428-Ditylum_brightwellii.AAC.1
MADADVNSFRVDTPTDLAPASTPILFPTQRAYIAINDISDHICAKTGLSIVDMTRIDWGNLGMALERQQLFTKVQLV